MTSVQVLIIFSFLLTGAVIAIILYMSAQMRKLTESLGQKDGEKMLMEWVKGSQESVERQLKNQRDEMVNQTKMIGDRLDTAAKVIGDVRSRLGSLEKFERNVEDLSNVLKSPKLRGGLGEQMLYEILDNFLPKELYSAQYKFKEGAVCDAVIFLDKGIIPIDSKFSMENFKAMISAQDEDAQTRYKREFVKDVKKRIDEISKKYILPAEGTTDWAVMYIPSENSYYELTVNTPEINEYAQKRSVFLTSPNTFTYFVKTVMLAHQQNTLAEHATEILRALSGIKVDAEKFGEDLSVLDRHITHASKSVENVQSKFGKLFNKLEGVQALGQSKDTLVLPEPD